MSRRSFTSLGMLAGATVIMSLFTVLGQGARSSQTALRTPWGDPDLQGIWHVTASASHEGNYGMTGSLVGSRAQDRNRDGR